MRFPIDLSGVRCRHFRGINEVRIERQKGRGIRVALSQLPLAPEGHGRGGNTWKERMEGRAIAFTTHP